MSESKKELTPEEIKENEVLLERFMFLLSGSPDGTWDWDMESGEFYFSDRSSEMLGYTPGELPAAFSTIIDLVHEDDLGEMLEVWSEYMEGNTESYLLQYRMKQKDENYLWVEARGISAKRPGEEEPYRLAGYHADISIRKQQEAQLAEKTADINNMLHNMKQGVFTVIPGSVVHPEYSRFLEDILDTKDIAGRSVMELLFEGSNLGADSKDQVEVGLSAIIGEDEMQYDFNSHLLATEIQRGEGDAMKVIQLEWVPILDADDVIEKILVIAQDVTEERRLAIEADKQRVELDIISQILKISMEKFNSFIETSYEYINDNRKIVKETKEKDPDTLTALFRNMHTIKGNSRTYELVNLTDTIHEVEQRYDNLRKDPDAVWDETILLEELDLAETVIKKYDDINSDKLGRKGRSADQLTSRGTFIAQDELESLKALTQEESANSPLMADIFKRLKRVGQIPLERLSSGAMDSVFSLAKELGKPKPIFDLQDHGAHFSHQIAEPLKSSFMHIVRNCVDHGIESGEDRVAAGKPEAGTILFEAIDNGDHAVIRIKDDGRGLALHKVYEKAVTNGLIPEGETPPHIDVAKLIFHSGLSTAEAVTQVSGRGVGMEAVQAFLEKQGGSIGVNLIDNTLAEGKYDFVNFEFILTVTEDQFCMG